MEQVKLDPGWIMTCSRGIGGALHQRSRTPRGRREPDDQHDVSQNMRANRPRWNATGAAGTSTHQASAACPTQTQALAFDG